MPFLWAAYKRGALHVKYFPEGLSQEEFKIRFSVVLEGVDEAYVFLGDVPKKGIIPVGVGIIQLDEHRAWPHLWWFPEATSRQKLEIATRFAIELKKRFLLMVICVHKDKMFFDRLCRIGVLRRVGSVDGWIEGETNMALYQSRE